MNQDVLFSQYLEELTDTITNLDHFNIQKTYDILKQLCIAFRVCKGVAEYYNNAEEERLGCGTVLTCYDSGEETAEVISCRTVLSNIVVADCKAFRAKETKPWTDAERKRIEMVERLMLTVVGRLRPPVWWNRPHCLTTQATAITVSSMPQLSRSDHPA